MITFCRLPANYDPAHHCSHHRSRHRLSAHHHHYQCSFHRHFGARPCNRQFHHRACQSRRLQEQPATASVKIGIYLITLHQPEDTSCATAAILVLLREQLFSVCPLQTFVVESLEVVAALPSSSVLPVVLAARFPTPLDPPGVGSLRTPSGRRCAMMGASMPPMVYAMTVGLTPTIQRACMGAIAPIAARAAATTRARFSILIPMT